MLFFIFFVQCNKCLSFDADTLFIPLGLVEEKFCEIVTKLNLKSLDESLYGQLVVQVMKELICLGLNLFFGLSTCDDNTLG